MNATSTANASISDPEFLLSLREDVAGLPHSGAKEFLDFLRVMWSEGATETGLRSRFGPRAPISQWLSELARKGWICYSAVSDGRRLATFIPTSSQTAFDPLIRLSGGPQALSRFVLMRRDDRNLVLESPLSASKVLLHDADAIALAVAFMTPTCAADVLSRARLRNADTEMVLSILANAGAIVPVDVAGREQAPVGSDDWEVHDLFFHSRSRAGRHVNRYGRRRPSGGKPEHLEAQGEPSNGISLYAPDIDVLKTTDPPFAKVVEERRSIRPAASAAALGLRQLGEFLYRAARWKSDGRRPYPGAGSCYELELYLAVRQCIGLEPGFYRYDAAAHRLCRLTEVTPASVELLEEARLAAGASDPPQILVLYAARMQSLTARYQSIAYALALKDAGVLQQTMCLTATAMGLAGCAIGGGNSDVFARASGKDYYIETSVGEFLLGGLPVAENA